MWLISVFINEKNILFYQSHIFYKPELHQNNIFAAVKRAMQLGPLPEKGNDYSCGLRKSYASDFSTKNNVKKPRHCFIVSLKPASNNAFLVPIGICMNGYFARLNRTHPIDILNGMRLFLLQFQTLLVLL